MKWNLPNLLSVVRLVGAPMLIGLAWLDLAWWFISLYAVLAATDLVDGLLARRFAQRTDLGALLDSAADVTLSICLLLGVALLRWSLIYPEWPWLMVAAGAWCTALIVCFQKFGKFASYHTWSAKVAHLLVAAGGALLVIIQQAWPLRVAMVAVTLANIESLLITIKMRQWQADVNSLITLSSQPTDSDPPGEESDLPIDRQSH